MALGSYFNKTVIIYFVSVFSCGHLNSCRNQCKDFFYHSLRTVVSNQQNLDFYENLVNLVTWSQFSKNTIIIQTAHWNTLWRIKSKVNSLKSRALVITIIYK